MQSIIDLLIPGQSPGIKGPIVDVSGRKDPEILFFGPDENSADLMDWAAEHARARNAPWWKSFTTGKSAAKLGGIPHDICELVSICGMTRLTILDGMTSLSVRQYILGVMKAHGLSERDVTKFQTGGPDGDLGSSEFHGERVYGVMLTKQTRSYSARTRLSPSLTVLVSCTTQLDWTEPSLFDWPRPEAPSTSLPRRSSDPKVTRSSLIRRTFNCLVS
jgi:hypothetical protein